MHRLSLLQRRPQRAMQPVFKIELATPRHHVGEEIAVKCGVLFQQSFQIERPLRCDELVQTHLVGSNRCPLLLHVAVIWIRTYVPDALENHCNTLDHQARTAQCRHRYDSDMTEPTGTASGELSSEVQEIVAGYTFDEPAIELGVLMENRAPVPSAVVRIPMAMLNRHGLVAGATGTGKTKTLQLMAEQISAAGVPVFAADVKGDLSGIASPGQPNEKLLARTEKIGQDWQPRAFPVEFFALGGQGLGVPLRATMSSFGPVLLAKVLGLNEVQESSLGLVFHYADQAGLPLLDLKDLRAVLTHLTSDEGKAELKSIGGLSAATVGVILRTLITFADQGAEEFFGEPEFNTADLLRVTRDGQGVVSLLELPNLVDRPALFSTFLMWLLADLFHELPEVGDVDKPKLVFFFDEAHLLFADASKAFLDAIAQTVRLIRSKGVGIFFVTQTPKDVPDAVLAQLGSRVQHQLRAHTPNDAKALKQTVADVPQVPLRPGRGSAAARHRRGDRHRNGSRRRPDAGRLDPDAGPALTDGADSGGGAAARHRDLRPDGSVRPGDRPGLRARDAGTQAAGRSRGGRTRTSGRRGRGGGSPAGQGGR